jgi:hypothetical protein
MKTKSKHKNLTLRSQNLHNLYTQSTKPQSVESEFEAPEEKSERKYQKRVAICDF